MTTAIMLGIIGVDAILLAIALSLDKDKHFLFRLLTYFFVNFSFVIVSKFIIDWSSGQAYEGTALIFHKFVLGWITIFGIYVFIYFVYEVLKFKGILKIKEDG